MNVLNDDSILCVLTALPAKDIFQCATVCKRWCRIVGKPMLWKVFLSRYYDVQVEEERLLQSSGSSLPALIGELLYDAKVVALLASGLRMLHFPSNRISAVAMSGFLREFLTHKRVRISPLPSVMEDLVQWGQATNTNEEYAAAIVAFHLLFSAQTRIPKLFESSKDSQLLPHPSSNLSHTARHYGKDFHCG